MTTLLKETVNGWRGFYAKLGLTTGFIVNNLSDNDRKIAYEYILTGQTMNLVSILRIIEFPKTTFVR